jgi:hypothetical protein
VLTRVAICKVWECAKASLDTEADNRTEADMENIVKFSKRLPFFKYVSTAAREALCRRMEHIVLQEGELAIKEPKDMDFVWFIVVKGRCDMMFKTEDTGKHYPIRAFEEGDTFAYSYLKMLTGDANAQEHGDIRAREANTSVVRVYVEEEHRGDFRSQTKPLLYEELAKYFNMSADQAADRLGLCMSAIKKICRRHGIIRWPHRKLLSANKSLALIDSKMAEVEQTPQGQAMLRNDALSILVSKLRVMLNPTYLVNSELVHSTTGGGQHTPGRADEMFELEGSLSPNSDDGSDEESPHEVGGGFKRKKNGKAGLHDKDERFKKSRGHERGHDNHVDHRGIENGPGRDNWRPTTNGADGGGNMSIEHMSDMVRASLEQVPENVREQVLSLVITNMQSSKASKHGRAQEHNMLSGAGGWNSQPQHLHPMSGRHHPYLPISNSMHPTRRSNQSVHYPISHVSAPQSLEGNPNYVMEGGAYSHASRDSSGFNQHLVLPRYGPDANATRNDDSSDDEGAPPTSSADKWSGHHSLNRYAQVLALPLSTGRATAPSLQCAGGGPHPFTLAYIRACVYVRACVRVSGVLIGARVVMLYVLSLQQGMPGAGWNLQNLGPLDRILQNSSAMPGGPGGGIDMPGVRGGPHGQMNPSVLGRGPMGHVGNRNHEPNQRPGERKILPPIPAVKSPVGSNPPSSLHFLESSVGKDDRQPSGKGMELLGMLSAPVDGEGQVSDVAAAEDGYAGAEDDYDVDGHHLHDNHRKMVTILGCLCWC